jgi:hypothetical protein
MKFKTEKDQARFFNMHPLMIMIAGDMAGWCLARNIPFVITSTVTTLEEDTKLGRKSSTHREARAFDLRSSVFNDEQREAFMKYFEAKYKDIAAIVTGGFRRLVVYHNSGHGAHFHIQIEKKYALKPTSLPNGYDGV